MDVRYLSAGWHALILVLLWSSLPILAEDRQPITFSGKGSLTTDAVFLPEGAFEYRFTHQTEANNRLVILSVDVDTNLDGEFCGDLDSGCGLIFNAGNAAVKDLDRSGRFSRYFFGGMTRFSVEAVGPWSIEIEPEPFPRQRVRGALYSLAQDGTRIPLANRTVEISAPATETLSIRTGSNGRFDTRVYRHGPVTFTAKLDDGRTIRQVISLATFQQHKPSRPLSVSLELDEARQRIQTEKLRLVGVDPESRVIQVSPPLRIVGVVPADVLITTGPLRLVGVEPPARLVETGALRLHGVGRWQDNDE